MMKQAVYVQTPAQCIKITLETLDTEPLIDAPALHFVVSNLY